MNYLQALFLLAVVVTSNAMGATIDYTTENHLYKRYPDQMEIIVRNHQSALNDYLGRNLECRLVKLKFNNFQSPTLLKKGEYNLSLKAECNKSFKNLKVDVDYGYSLGEPLALIISFTSEGKSFEKIIGKIGEDD